LFRRQYPQHRERLLATADAINDPFEQALIRRNLSPLSFVDVSRDTHTEAMPSAVENRPSLIKSRLERSRRSVGPSGCQPPTAEPVASRVASVNAGRWPRCSSPTSVIVLFTLVAHRQHDHLRRTDDLVQRDISRVSERDDQFALRRVLGGF
jgi:hypothetical protein